MRNLHLFPKAMISVLLLCGVLGHGRVAQAACASQPTDTSNDLSLECLVGKRTPGQSSDPTLLEQSNYRSLISELSAVMAMPVLDPADTVGFSGFHFTADTTLTTISQNAEYWSGKADASGNRAGAGVSHVTGGLLPVISLTIRKGMWTPLPPLPSVELGLGASNLLSSGLYAINGYFKFALHEGYHDNPFPSFAVRASVSRITGASEIDLTLINADGIISKAFGAGGTLTFEPYLGGGVMFSIARSQVVDTAPTIDLYRGPLPSGANSPPFDDNARAAALAQKVSFPTQNDILRWRLFAGLHIHYAILALTAGFTYFGAGSDNGFDLATLPTNATLPAANRAAACRSDPTGNVVCPKDLAAAQYQVGLSLGLRF